MKNLTILLLSALAFTLTGCYSTHAEKSVQMARSGTTAISEYFVDTPKDILRKVTLNALIERKWTIVDAGEPIVATYTKGYQSAKLTITITDGNILFETRGSKMEGKDYVPLNYLRHLTRTIRKSVKIYDVINHK